MTHAVTFIQAVGVAPGTTTMYTTTGGDTQHTQLLRGPSQGWIDPSNTGTGYGPGSNPVGLLRGGMDTTFFQFVLGLLIGCGVAYVGSKLYVRYRGKSGALRGGFAKPRRRRRRR